jgi:hypothetical protein
MVRVGEEDHWQSLMRTVRRMHVATMPHAIASTAVRAAGGFVGYWL